ncbi:DnaJ C-terminal domain-containing protein [Streptomyces sp. NPDC001604]|uniref:caspase, EACC1-associated type n=1 Tax=Streptomyces sp. NPDC001604 TaxID=3364593 RepID=UPI00367A80E7
MTDFAFGPGRRDALLIATGAYDDRTLSTLRSPGQDCASLAGVLADPGIGGFRTEQLKDAQAHQVMRAVERFFLDRSRDDLLLLHISCHGIKDDDGHLYFAARDTDRDLPASTAVPAAFLRDRMERCRARTVVVLLDCCYSGAFLPGAKGDDQVHVRDELGGHGRAVLTATNRTEYAWEGAHVKSKVPQPSRFTGALIEGLSTGAADLNGDGRITVTELYEYVYESLHRAGVKQRPRIWADLEYQVTVARTAGEREPAGNTGGAESPWEPPAAPAGGQWDFSDLFDQFPKPRPRTRPGQDALIKLEHTLEETAFGTVKEIRVDTAVLCPTCSGRGGTQASEAEPCHSCRGTGWKKRAWSQSRQEWCRKCDGSGVLMTPLCHKCSGDGRVRSRRTLTVKIPAGVENGTRIRLAGQGEVGPGGGPAGDLYVEVAELAHPHLSRTGDDLHTTLKIPSSTAVNGGTVSVDTLDGPKQVRIPKGSPDGRILRLANLGATHLKVGGRGDLLLHLNIQG